MKPEDLTPPQRQDFIRAYADHDTFCRESLKIRDLSANLVPFIQGAGQRKLTRAIEKQRLQNKPVRIVVLKTRRSWFTAGSCSHIFKQMATWPGQKCTVIADQYKPAGLEAFGYLKDFNRNYEPIERHGAAIAIPSAVKDSEQRLELDNESFVEVLSADAGEIRGGGRAAILLDEAAFWRTPEKTMGGVLNMVPKRTNTMVIVQSTANGIGGEFYELVQQARDPLNKSGWDFLFFGWLEHEEYHMHVADPAALQRSLDNEEKLLQSLYGATLEQLEWRRHTIATECSRSVDTFHQEYPTTVDEAFLSTGRPALNHKAIARNKAIDGVSGELLIDEDPPRHRIYFNAGGNRGALTIYQQPQQGRFYCLGADPSEGKDVSSAQRGRDPDYSVAWVADADTGQQVALLRERIRPAAFADYIAQLAKFYNYAFVCPEANNAGFIDSMIRTEYPLQFMYHAQRLPGDLKSSQPHEIGFYVDSRTRPMLISAYDDAISTGEITIASAICISESYTFVIKPNGRVEHRVDCHDDCVLTGGHMVMAKRQAPKRKQEFSPEYRRKAIHGYGRARKPSDDD